MSTGRKCAVFSCMGLGDGLLALVLSHNLWKMGFEVKTYHPFLREMQSWFPFLPIIPFSCLEGVEEELSQYERIFIFYEKSPWMQEILARCVAECPTKTLIINPIATPNTDYPYWENARFDGQKSFLWNLENFCKTILKFPHASKENGIAIPRKFQSRKNLSRVVIHPTSSRAGKNWAEDKYLELANQLRVKGFYPVFILTAEEKKQWPESEIETPAFSSIQEIAAYICESGYMIGNDSGIGHLASCLGLPTVTICRSKMTANFWRPYWSPGEIVTPPSWVPNFKGWRLRDKYWREWIPVEKVLDVFDTLRNF